ncbi:MAG: polysaccharide deacetylase family protein [Planctomycetaceae bacterium]|nr:polysaccharide deacetylase family protein [Planctomycetaceae bacterium]
MLCDQDLNGGHLPQRTVALTFDDGPGPHTRELARFLYENCIQATFFVIGRVAADQSVLLRKMIDWGHRIGNHTWSHPGLVDLALAGGNVVAEVARADDVIRRIAAPPMLLRPPYGSWRSDAPPVNVARLLRDSRRFDDYIGPVMWDIVGEDWTYWERGSSVEQCLLRHVAEIERIGRGIVLLHDSSEDPRLMPGNRTMEMAELLVPVLRSRGFCFATLDEAIEQ